MCLSDRVAQWVDICTARETDQQCSRGTDFLLCMVRCSSIRPSSGKQLTNYSSTQTEVRVALGWWKCKYSVYFCTSRSSELFIQTLNPFTSTLLAWTKSLVLPWDLLMRRELVSFVVSKVLRVRLPAKLKKVCLDQLSSGMCKPELL